MTLFDYSHILTDTVDKLSDNNSYGGLFHQHKDGEPLPSDCRTLSVRVYQSYA